MQCNTVEAQARSGEAVSGRELEEFCVRCGWKETIEEKRFFDEKQLAISVCPKCKYVNWMTSDDVDLDTLAEWAEEEGRKMLKDRGKFFNVHFVWKAKVILGKNLEEFRKKVEELCEILHTSSAYVGTTRSCIKIVFGEKEWW